MKRVGYNRRMGSKEKGVVTRKEGRSLKDRRRV
jgi:hypothetical protein